jgi:hypothetical protein
MDISYNKGQKYDLGHNPSIEFVGYTDLRMYISGTGRLDLTLGASVIDSQKAILVEGFDQVIIHSGNLLGGIQGIKNKAYYIHNVSISTADTGILINSGDWVEAIDLHRVHIRDCQDEGMYIGQSRSMEPHIGRLSITDCSAINCGKDNLQIGAVKFGDVRDSVFTNKLTSRTLPTDPTLTIYKGIYIRRPFGQDKDVMINPNSHIRMKNVHYETIFVHPRSQINTI